MTQYITIGETRHEVEDCVSWIIYEDQPRCMIGQDLSQCKTCARRRVRASVVEKARNFIKAQASRVTHSPLTQDQIQDRLDICTKCEYLDKEKLTDGQVGYCSVCGCGRNPLAELTIKGKLPMSVCVKNKWPVALPIAQPPQ